MNAGYLSLRRAAQIVRSNGGTPRGLQVGGAGSTHLSRAPREPAAARGASAILNGAAGSTWRSLASTGTAHLNRAQRDQLTAPASDAAKQALASTKKTYDEEGNEIIYNGPFNPIVRRVKVLSLCSCMFTTTLGPVVMFLNDPYANLDPIVQLAVGGLVSTFGIFTTVFLSWFVGPYVFRMGLSPDGSNFVARRMNWRLQEKDTTIPVGSQAPVDILRPLVNFESEGKHYYIVPEHMHGPFLREQFPWLFEDEDSEEKKKWRPRGR